jgi:hypothetical protein
MSFSLYEDFSRYANATVMAGQLPLIGPVWGTSFAPSAPSQALDHTCSLSLP